MLEPQEDEFTADPIFASYDDAVAWLDGNGDSDVDNGFDTLTHTNTIDLTELQDSDAEDCGPSHVYILPASSEVRLSHEICFQQCVGLTALSSPCPDLL